MDSVRLAASSSVPLRPRGPVLPAPLEVAIGALDCAACCLDIRLTRAGGAQPIAAAAQRRLDALVAHARAHSRLYRALYRDVPAGPVALAGLPPVRRASLMADFDGWVTDPSVSLSTVRDFLARRERVGAPFLGRFRVWTSSGSTGAPGIFVQDDAALAVYDALALSPPDARALTLQAWMRLVTGGARAALIVATGDHYASIASWQRIVADNPALMTASWSITTPLPELVAGLNRFRPALVATYPTMAALLADEQRAGRLAIAPAAIWCGGECLPAALATSIARAFECRVHNEYGASECLVIASSCAAGALHVHADWVLLEPIDADGRPTPPGAVSHSVLLTNLANRVQPVIRYDLGDSVRMLPGACRCGSPLPVIEVHGRRDDVLALRACDGKRVRLIPLALECVIEGAVGARPFRIVQKGPDRLALALGGPDADRALYDAAAAALRRHLADAGLPDVRVVHDARPVALDSRTGKLRRVVSL